MIKSIFLTYDTACSIFFIFFSRSIGTLCCLCRWSVIPMLMEIGNFGQWEFIQWQILHKMVLPAWPIAILIALMGLLACISIFLYKNRILQMKFCLFNGLMLLAFLSDIFLVSVGER